jgi:hypothetical protein
LNFQFLLHALTVLQQAAPLIAAPIIAAGRIDDDRHTATDGAASGVSLTTRGHFGDNYRRARRDIQGLERHESCLGQTFINLNNTPRRSRSTTRAPLKNVSQAPITEAETVSRQKGTHEPFNAAKST